MRGRNGNSRCRLIAIGMACALALSCQSLQSSGERPKDPAQLLRSYSFDLTSEFLDRLAFPPAFLIDYLNRMDKTDIYEGYELHEVERGTLADYYRGLPAVFRTVLSEKVIGIYFVENCMGGGMTEFVFGDDGSSYAILILNPETLRKSLSEWITFRDSSSYEDSTVYSLKSDCGEGYYGLLHTLTHEACHIYDYFQSVTNGFNLKSGGYTDFSRKVWKKFDEPASGDEFIDRKKLTVYGLGAALPFETAVAQYRALQNSVFPSIYGSMNVLEDFAETFTWAYLSRVYGISYEVVISKFGNEIVRYSIHKNDNATGRWGIIDGIE
jgi:hypothetical protein